MTSDFRWCEGTRRATCAGVISLNADVAKAATLLKYKDQPSFDSFRNFFISREIQSDVLRLRKVMMSEVSCREQSWQSRHCVYLCSTAPASNCLNRPTSFAVGLENTLCRQSVSDDDALRNDTGTGAAAE